MSRRRLTEGGKHSPRLPYVAMVEGSDHGVPFRTFYKRMSCAEKDAIETGGILTKLCCLTRQRFINGSWKEC
jgi:hypothetical protein